MGRIVQKILMCDCDIHIGEGWTRKPVSKHTQGNLELSTTNIVFDFKQLLK